MASVEAALNASVERVFDATAPFPRWPFLARSGFATLFEFGEVETPEFGQVLAALAEQYGDERVAVAPLATVQPAVAARALSVDVARTRDGYWDALWEAERASGGEAFLGIAEAYAIAGSSGIWGIWAQRDWEVAVVLSPDDDGPWLHTDVPWWPRDAYLPDLRGPAGWVEPLSSEDLRAFAAHLDARGGGISDHRPRRWKSPRLQPGLVPQPGGSNGTLPGPFGVSRSWPRESTVCSVQVSVEARRNLRLEVVALKASSLADAVAQSGGALPGWPHLIVADAPRNAAYAHLAELVAACGADWTPEVLDALGAIGRITEGGVPHSVRPLARLKHPRQGGRVAVDRLGLSAAPDGGWWASAVVARSSRRGRSRTSRGGHAVKFRVVTPAAAQLLVSGDRPAHPSGGLLLAHEPSPPVIAQAIASQMAPFVGCLPAATERFTALAERVLAEAGLR